MAPPLTPLTPPPPSPLPLSPPPDLLYFTSRECFDVESNSGDTAKIFSGLNPNKAHDHDMISIRMLKICGEPICKPLEYISGLFK